MSSNQQPSSASTATATTEPRPFPENPFRFTTDWDLETGKYQAVCIDYEIIKRHTRLKFDKSGTEQVDFVVFLFRIIHGKHANKTIATNCMTTTIHPKSNLHSFLFNWLNRMPESPFIAQSFVNMGATIEVELVPGNKKPGIGFARLVGVGPDENTDVSTGVEKGCNT